MARHQKNSQKFSVGAVIVLASSVSVNKCLKANHATMYRDCAPTTFRLAKFHVEHSMPHSSQVSILDKILASYLCYTMGSNT